MTELAKKLTLCQWTVLDTVPSLCCAFFSIPGLTKRVPNVGHLMRHGPFCTQPQIRYNPQ